MSIPTFTCQSGKPSSQNHTHDFFLEIHLEKNLDLF